jgi:hypothetical protein
MVADVTEQLTITADTWVIVVARGTDGVSEPLFPMSPQDLTVRQCNSLGNDGAACSVNADCIFGTCVNTSLAELTDNGTSPPWNVNEDGQLATAFSNPLFFDFEPDGNCHGGTPCP